MICFSPFGLSAILGRRRLCPVVERKGEPGDVLMTADSPREIVDRWSKRSVALLVSLTM
jgi:hypothetical protein